MALCDACCYCGCCSPNFGNHLVTIVCLARVACNGFTAIALETASPIHLEKVVCISLPFTFFIVIIFIEKLKERIYTSVFHYFFQPGVGFFVIRAVNLCMQILLLVPYCCNEDSIAKLYIL